MSLTRFEQVWVYDFEYCYTNRNEGNPPSPVCMVAYEVNSRTVLRLWFDGSNHRPRCPFRVDERSVFLAYSAPADLQCFLVLGWPIPKYNIDLRAEFRALANQQDSSKSSLLWALNYYGLPAIASDEKDAQRDRILQGWPFSADERREIMDYCESDVIGTVRLWFKLAVDLNWNAALFRGAVAVAVARTELRGIPVDAELIETVKTHRVDLQRALIAEKDTFQIYRGINFEQRRFAAFLRKNRIPWPRHTSGQLKLDRDVFRRMAELIPALAPLAELRQSISLLREFKLPVGDDGFARCSLIPFSTRTGRNTPPANKFIFTMPQWARYFIKPPVGYGCTYIDFAQEEFLIAAVRSGDKNMIQAYYSGDPYLQFAIMAGAAPADATAASHGDIRSQYKIAALAVQFMMGEHSLAKQLNSQLAFARHLLQQHRAVFADFWRWSDGIEAYVAEQGYLNGPLGWRIQYTDRVKANPRSARNFPVQSWGSGILWLTLAWADQNQLPISATVHDAVLVTAPVQDLPDVERRTVEVMETASAKLLDGYRVKARAESRVKYPGRMKPVKGAAFWHSIMRILQQQRTFRKTA